MPIYEYKCKKCGGEFEIFHKASDSDAKKCKFCQGPVNKLISLSSFQLQGSGWYVTDYGGKKPKTSEDAKEGIKSDAPSETKKEKVDTPSPSTDKKLVS